MFINYYSQQERQRRPNFKFNFLYIYHLSKFEKFFQGVPKINFFVWIPAGSSYELPCKIWSVQLKKWPSYGHFLDFPKFENFFRESLKLFFLHGSLQAVHTNFHAKSGVCSSKNERVIALGTKEDGHTLLSIFKQLYSPNLFV